ncbi:helix-turn-helix domain-containing protein [Mariniflexile maritimum]|nr:helix-turn-helix transcriptional regulator [Mariniflexile maritimum]
MEVLRLKELLKEKCVSGKELAEKVNVTPASISNISKAIVSQNPTYFYK